MKRPLRLLDDFLSLLYPNLCLACNENLVANQEVLCLRCRYQLPKTDFHLHEENIFTERFWGRLPISSGASFCHFIKGGSVQKLIHRLKYDGKKSIGVYLGKLYGESLQESTYFKDVDLILPVPLHPKKERRRGYNQSDLFAQGLSASMNIPWNRDVLIRRQFTTTQTAKSRIDRFANVVEAFEVKNGHMLPDKHVLIVDDVMTTGATLEACGIKVLEAASNVKLSFATIAMANN